MVTEMFPSIGQSILKQFRISLQGHLGKHTVTPRGLKSNLVHKLVKV